MDGRLNALLPASAPTAPQDRLPLPAAMLSAYQPTLRDRIALGLVNALGGSPLAQDMVGSLMGSRGIGAGKSGVVDFIPLVGNALQAAEAGRQMAQGQPLAGAWNLATAAVPLPAAAKGLKLMALERGPLARLARVAEPAAESVMPKTLGTFGQLGQAEYQQLQPGP